MASTARTRISARLKRFGDTVPREHTIYCWILGVPQQNQVTWLHGMQAREAESALGLAETTCVHVL